MKNPWFRMYAEFLNDPKVQMLSETDQRRYIMLLCLRCNGHVTLHETEIAFQLRISDEEWCRTKAVLMERHLISNDNNPTAWDKRQYPSDSSVERVRRHREGKRNADVTLQKRRDNAVDSDTDTEVNPLAQKSDEREISSSAAPSDGETASKPTRKRKPADDRFAEFWLRYPRKVAKADAEKAWNAAHINGEYQQVIDALEAQKRTEQWTRDEGRFVPYASTWIRHQRWRDELGQKPSPLAAAFGGAL